MAEGELARWDTATLKRFMREWLRTEFGVVPLHRIVGELPNVTLKERGSAPDAPDADQVVVYAIDNGAGKTQVMARFHTGAPVQLGIEP